MRSIPGRVVIGFRGLVVSRVSKQSDFLKVEYRGKAKKSETEAYHDAAEWIGKDRTRVYMRASGRMRPIVRKIYAVDPAQRSLF